MEIKNVDGLKGYPDPLIANTEKGDAYILSYIRSAFNSWSTGGAGSFYADRTRKLAAQSYRLGQQDPAQIMNLVNLKGEITEVNINFSPLPIVQRFCDLMVNNILNSNFKLGLEFSDNISIEKKDKFRTNLKESMLGASIAQRITDVTGVDVTDKDVPADEEDLELMLEVDYRDLDEISLMAFLNAVKNMNGFEDIKREIVDDVVTHNEGVTCQEIDEKEGIVIEYIPSLNFIRSTSKDKSNKNLQHAGHIKTITFSELRSMIKKSDGITDDELNEIAKGIATKTGGYGNVNWDDPIYADRIYGSSRWYDELSIDVIKMSFMDINYDLYEKKQTKLGLPVIHKRPDGYQLPKNSLHERVLFTDAYQTVLQGTWIRGTEFVLGAGRADNILLQGKELSKCRLPYSVYTFQGKSMCERMIPYADQMWITHVKHQHLVAKLRPTGVHADISALEDALAISDTEYYEPLDLLDFYDISGNVLYRGDTEEDGMTRKGPPIGPMANSMGTQLTELTNLYNHNLEIIRDMTNVSKFLDGSQVSSKTLVGVQKQGIEQSNMGISHISDAYEFLVKDSAKVCIMMIQDVFKYPGLTKAYGTAIGKFSLETVKRIKNIPIEQLNIKITYAMTDQERAVLDNDINVSIQAGELRIEDAIMIREIDSVRLANKMLIKRKKVYAKEKAELEQVQHQQAMEAEQAKSQAKSEQIGQEAMAKANAEIMVAVKLDEIETKANIQKQADALALIDREYGHKKDIEKIAASSEMNKVEKVEQKKDDRINQTKSAESKIASQKENNESPIDFTAQFPEGVPL